MQNVIAAISDGVLKIFENFKWVFHYENFFWGLVLPKADCKCSWPIMKPKPICDITSFLCGPLLGDWLCCQLSVFYKPVCIYLFHLGLFPLLLMFCIMAKCRTLAARSNISPWNTCECEWGGSISGSGLMVKGSRLIFMNKQHYLCHKMCPSTEFNGYRLLLKYLCSAGL